MSLIEGAVSRLLAQFPTLEGVQGIARTTSEGVAAVVNCAHATLFGPSFSPALEALIRQFPSHEAAKLRSFVNNVLLSAQFSESQRAAALCLYGLLPQLSREAAEKIIVSFIRAVTPETLTYSSAVIRRLSDPDEILRFIQSAGSGRWGLSNDLSLQASILEIIELFPGGKTTFKQLGEIVAFISKVPVLEREYAVGVMRQLPEHQKDIMIEQKKWESLRVSEDLWTCLLRTVKWLPDDYNRTVECVEKIAVIIRDLSKEDAEYVTNTLDGRSKSVVCEDVSKSIDLAVALRKGEVTNAPLLADTLRTLQLLPMNIRTIETAKKVCVFMEARNEQERSKLLSTMRENPLADRAAKLGL